MGGDVLTKEETQEYKVWFKVNDEKEEVNLYIPPHLLPCLASMHPQAVKRKLAELSAEQYYYNQEMPTTSDWPIRIFVFYRKGVEIGAGVFTVDLEMIPTFIVECGEQI